MAFLTAVFLLLVLLDFPVDLLVFLLLLLRQVLRATRIRMMTREPPAVGTIQGFSFNVKTARSTTSSLPRKKKKMIGKVVIVM